MHFPTFTSIAILFTLILTVLGAPVPPLEPAEPIEATPSNIRSALRPRKTLSPADIAALGDLHTGVSGAQSISSSDNEARSPAEGLEFPEIAGTNETSTTPRLNHGHAVPVPIIDRPEPRGSSAWHMSPGQVGNLHTGASGSPASVNALRKE